MSLVRPLVRPLVRGLVRSPLECRGGFHPASLFSANEPGALFYCEDALTVSGDGVFLFQDSAGTTPVTAVGQAVGLYLDRRFGRTQMWSNMAAAGVQALNASSSVLVNGEEVTVTSTAAGTFGVRFNGIAPALGGSYLVLFEVVSNPSGRSIGCDLGGRFYSSFGSSTGQKRVAHLTASTTGVLFLYGQGAVGAGEQVTFRVSSVLSIPGNHRTQSITGSRPQLQQNGTTGRLCLKGDALDDFMSGPMDLSATDKLTVVAGLRKVSDASVAMAVELTAGATTNNGSFLMTSPNNATTANFGLAVRGTVGPAAGTTPSSFASPIAAVLTGQFDTSAATSATQVTGRVNGVAQTLAFSAGPTTAGNFSNSTCYYGSRAGTSLYSSQEEYALIIRGATTDAATLALAERWAASKAGISF